MHAFLWLIGTIPGTRAHAEGIVTVGQGHPVHHSLANVATGAREQKPDHAQGLSEWGSHVLDSHSFNAACASFNPGERNLAKISTARWA
jgi:hypothetical protein